jgi:hypothetical protein
MKLKRAHRKREEDLDKTHCPPMRKVPKFSKNYGLSNEISLENIGGGFLFHFFTLFAEQKAEKC